MISFRKADLIDKITKSQAVVVYELQKPGDNISTYLRISVDDLSQEFPSHIYYLPQKGEIADNSITQILKACHETSVVMIRKEINKNELVLYLQDAPAPNYIKADLIDHIRPTDHTPFHISVRSFEQDGSITFYFSQNWNPQDQEDLVHYLEIEMEVEFEMISSSQYEILAPEYSVDTVRLWMKRIRDLINAKFGTSFDVVVGDLEIRLDHHDLERYL